MMPMHATRRRYILACLSPNYLYMIHILPFMSFAMISPLKRAGLEQLLGCWLERTKKISNSFLPGSCLFFGLG